MAKQQHLQGIMNTSFVLIFIKIYRAVLEKFEMWKFTDVGQTDGQRPYI